MEQCQKLLKTNVPSEPSKNSFMPSGKSRNQNKQLTHCREKLSYCSNNTESISVCIKHNKQNKSKVQAKCHRLLFCFKHNVTRAACLGLCSY